MMKNTTEPTQPLRLTRGGFLTALALSVTSAVSILQGCAGKGADASDTSVTREQLLGRWRASPTEFIEFKSDSTYIATFAGIEDTGAWTLPSIEAVILVSNKKDTPERLLSIHDLNSSSLIIRTGPISSPDVTYTKEIVPTPIPTPTPIPVPTPAPITFTISPSAITATHTVGVSPCPQLLGTIKVKNTGSNAISVILPAVSDLELSTPGFTLAAGEEKDVTVKFNCANFPPLTKTITFYLAPTTSGAATHTSTVTVQLNAG